MTPASQQQPSPQQQSQTATPSQSPSPPRENWSKRIWSAAQFLVALAITVGFLLHLLFGSASKPASVNDERPAPVPHPVQQAGQLLLRIDAATPLGLKLQIVELSTNRVSAPALTVTGTVAASLRPSLGRNVGNVQAFLAVAGAMVSGAGSDYWQFNSPEVLTAYTDWQKAKADIVFSRTQALQIKAAAAARNVAQQELVQTLRKLVEAGTETRKQLVVEEATLRQYQIQEAKEIHEADTAIRVAERNETALSRQFQQAGLDPQMLASATSDIDIVMAEVPEAFLSRVKVGQGCIARFFGVPDQTFPGAVRSISPTLSKERRSLRVLFTIEDVNDQLRPGMFAEIGLGTDPRDALLAPAEGVIHIGRSDYMLVANGTAGVWRIKQVEVGEMREGRVEITEGLKAGDRVIGPGAILLKPVVADSLKAQERESAVKGGEK